MSKNILVVDDDPQMVRTLCDILALHGWDPEGAMDGRQALQAVERHTYSAVVMDVRMPGMNGVEAFRAMRRTRPGIRVILMTAFAATELLAEAEREGVVTVFSKPIDVRALLAMLRQSLGRVLLVDDDPDFLRTLTDIVARDGFTVSRATSVDQALALLTRDPPTVVVLDLILNKHDPAETVAAMRRANPGVVFILYSGHPAVLDKTAGAVPAEWVRATFQKPFDVQELLAELHDVAED